MRCVGRFGRSASPRSCCGVARVVRVGSGNFGDYKPTHEKGDPYVSLALIVVSITQRVMRGGDSPR